ncbi:MAG: pyridoxamine 5'-phosphate oxidase [Candidatus Kapaibacterium sp.]|nr:MAG: pyridoxamine 5'-phosphate oxidase [Candidatus Kapabacteria bacterium]
MNRDDISQMRRSYTLAGLDEHAVAPSPFAQFSDWFAEARASISGEANAMTLSTVNPDNTPSARIVLLKDMDERGFVFYTNYDSAKGQAIAHNPHVCLNFFWSELERQVRIVGKAEKISPEESDAYFQSRPLESRLGAWASAQSSVIAGRAVLEERFAALQEEYAEKPVPLPPFWGGYRVVPYEMEFWQGRVGRLHDRIVYRLAEAGEWRISRRAP